MTNRKTRILTGVKFFRSLGSRNYDAAQVKKYLPVFLGLVESEVTGAPDDEELIKQAEAIFGTKTV